MFTHKSMILSALTLVTALIIGACQLVASPPTKQVELQFVSHIMAQMPEQDVYVLKPDADNRVHRIEASEAEQYMASPVYAAAAAVKHDPFVVGDEPFGPYPKGSELGFTMAEWLGGAGHGVYTVRGEQAELDLTFEKLRPDAVYTVWCATINLPPNVAITDEPCGAADGSENTFVTNANGEGQFHLRMAKLSDSTNEILKMIAIAYHSDGKTYGSLPGDFGLNSHVQLFVGLPTAESDAWKTMPDGAMAMQ